MTRFKRSNGWGKTAIITMLLLLPFRLAAQELIIEKLEVLLFSERDLHQVLDMLDLLDSYSITVEHPLVVGRMGLKVRQGFVQQAFLIGFDLFYGLVFYVVGNHCLCFKIQFLSAI